MTNKAILICGIPGTGKTTLSTNLAKLLNIDQVISTDFIREIKRSLIKKEYNLILFSVTHNSWKLFGDKTNENILCGAKEHARAIFPEIIHLIKNSQKEGRDIIIEGVHLIPEILDTLKEIKMKIVYIYLYVEDKEEHFKRFALKNELREVKNQSWYENYPVMKLIEENNIFEAKKETFP